MLVAFPPETPQSISITRDWGDVCGGLSASNQAHENSYMQASPVHPSCTAPNTTPIQRYLLLAWEAGRLRHACMHAMRPHTTSPSGDASQTRSTCKSAVRLRRLFEGKAKGALVLQFRFVACVSWVARSRLSCIALFLGACCGCWKSDWRGRGCLVFDL